MIKQIIIKTDNEKDMYNVLNEIHRQFKGMPDYINSEIVVNDSSARRDNTENEVHIYYSDNVKNIMVIVSNIFMQ